jgi:hypothetical protein
VAEERVRARGDHLFGQAGGLRHQVEVESDRGGVTPQDVPHVHGRQDVEAGQVADRVGVVESGAEGDEGAAVVSGQREALVPQRAGQLDDVGGHGPLGVDGLVGGGGFAARAVPAQVRSDHGVVGRQVGGDVPPHQVRLREAVQEHDRAARAGDGRVEGHAIGDGYAPVVEARDDRFHGLVLLLSVIRCPEPSAPG